MRVGPAITSVNAGEFGARMGGRTDFARYANSGREYLNVLPLPQGGIMRRPGTRFVAEVADSTKRGRLRRFRVSTIQSYILELGDGVVRFYKNQGRIDVEDTDAAITNGTFDSDISGWTDQSSGGTISHSSGTLALNNATSVAEQQISIGASHQSKAHVVRFRVIGAPGDLIKVRIGTTSGATDLVDDFIAHTGWHCVDFTPGAASVFLQFRNEDGKTKKIDDVAIIDNAPLQLSTGWLEADLKHMQFAQTSDVMYAVRGQQTAVYRFERYGDLRWSVEEVLFTDGPYLDENTTATTITPGAASGFGITFTASATTGINDDKGFLATDVGRVIRVYNGTKYAWGVIVGFTSTLAVTVDKKGDENFPTTAQTKWRLGEFSVETGYPGVIGFVQQRMGLAATTKEPQKFFLSQSAGIEDFTPDDLDGTTEADDAYSYRIAAEDVNTIVWMSYRRRLALGTIGGEWSVESDGPVLAPDDTDAVPQTSFGGSEIVPAIKARNRQLYVQFAGRKLLEYGYNFSDDAYQSLDLTVLNDRVLQSGVREAAYAQEPDSVIWLVREDGVLAALTYQPEQEVVGWSRHKIAGAFNSGDAVVESIDTIPGADGAGQQTSSEERTEVWMIVKRTINGQTKRYVEVMEKQHNGGEDSQEDAYPWDSLITYKGASAATISGLDHLEGETVSIWADGVYQQPKTVSGGQITLDRAATTVQAGLGFTGRWVSLELAYGAQGGSAQGRKKVPQRIGLKLLDTAETAIRLGAEGSDLVRVSLRAQADATKVAAPMFTGQTPLKPINAKWTEDTRMVIEIDQGPGTVLSIPFDLNINERM